MAENGKAVAGHVSVDLNGPATSGGTGRVRPFIWTPEGGSQMLPVPSSLRDARPNDISADGKTVLGMYDAQATGSTRFGARWVNGEFIPFSTPTMTVGEANESTPDGKITLRTAECLASCGTAPMMQVDKAYYENLTPADIDKLLERLQRD